MIVFLQKCASDRNVPPSSHTDTVIIYNTIKDTVVFTPILEHSRIDTFWQITYAPDTSYDKLLEQYINLGNNHYDTNVYVTPFPIKYGNITVTDTVYANKILRTNISYNLNIPETTITKTIFPEKKNEYFITSSVETFPSASIGLMMKNKKDDMYGVKVGTDFKGRTFYGITSMWKIKL
jgi:hypothetical protein